MTEQSDRPDKNARDGGHGSGTSTTREAPRPLEVLNSAESAEDLLEWLGLDREALGEARALLDHRRDVGGAFRSLPEVRGAPVGARRMAEMLEAARRFRLPPVDVPEERSSFRYLLAMNPNYFGTLDDSPLQPKANIQANTTFEDLPCVGLNTPFDRLEAVVRVKKSAGYGGSICGAGTREYVRFYVDLADDGTWHDVGLAWVRAHDIPGAKPLCYAVYRDFSPIRKLCWTENVVRVRAILSWNAPPPAGMPGFVPVWGERRDTEVVTRPRKLIIWNDVLTALDEKDVTLADPLGSALEALEPELEVGPVRAPAPGLAEKRMRYRKDEVPVHRYAFKEAMALVQSSASSEIFSSGEPKLAIWGLSDDEIADLVEQLTIVPVDGNTSFEEMTCIGFRPESSLLEAVVHVKKRSGYSGSLCSDGSREYVAFWGDFGDGAGFTYLGTTSVPVHDLATMPSSGVNYAVQLKKDLSQYLVPCQAGARVVRLRAILSWQAPPPPANPHWVPVWGNRVECRIQLRPGQLQGHIPLIETIGDIETPDIDGVGLATGPWASTSTPGAPDVAVQSPFSGSLMISGRIGDPPDSFGGGQPPFKYRIDVAPDGTNDWKPLKNDIHVKVTETVLGIPTFVDHSLSPNDDGDGLGFGWYPYLEDTKGFMQRAVWLDKLAVWQSGNWAEGVWKVRIRAKDPGSGQLYPGIQVVRVRLDHTRPSASTGLHTDGSTIKLTLTSAVYDGNPIEAVACGKFPVGTVLSGEYEAHDPGTTDPAQHFGHLSLSVLGPPGGTPTVSGSNVSGSPNQITFDGTNTGGAAGTWELDTAGMQACGYILRLWARDRTVVGGKVIGWRDTTDLGFCLEEAG